jgi:hypothetical protein
VYVVGPKLWWYHGLPQVQFLVQLSDIFEELSIRNLQCTMREEPIEYLVLNDSELNVC